MIDCLIWATFLSQEVGEIILDERTARVVVGRTIPIANLQCRLETGNRAVNIPALQEKIAQVVMRDVIVVGYSECVVPEHLAVFPVLRLYKRTAAQRYNDYYRDRCAKRLIAKL